MTIQEHIKNQVYNRLMAEIDWEGDFSDVKATCIPHDQMVKDLQDALERSLKPSSQRGKFPINKACVHRKAIQGVQTEEGDIDIQAFIDDITAIPKSLVTQNTKMAKSSGDGFWVVNTGIPALRGIVYDMDGGKFYQINTCPGAGTCAIVCYARKGSFVQYDNVSRNLTRRLNLLMNDPDLFEQKIYLELRQLCEEKNRKGIQVVMRWNDAGDFFTQAYWKIAVRVTQRLLSDGYNFKSYAYTKMGEFMKDLSHDITMNFSREANRKQLSQVDLDDTKASTIVPKELFADLFVSTGSGNHFEKDDSGKTKFKDKSGYDELKRRLAEKYKVPLDSIIYQEELPSEEQAPNTFNVIVLPSGDGDWSARREDVMLTFLLFH